MTLQQQFNDLETATGTMRCSVIRPTSTGAFPSILLYSEIFQISAPIARTAAYLAGHGYVVIIPEVFHELNPIGTVLGYDDAGKEKGNEDKFTKPLTDHDTDTEAMISWIDQQSFCNGIVGAFGVCLGGHLACRAALHARIKGTSCLYATDIHSSTMPAGNAPQTIEQLGKISGEILFIWGRQDPHVPIEGRKHLYDTISQTEITYSWHELNGQHAFLRDQGDRYDPELASLCYYLSLDLFHRALR